MRVAIAVSSGTLSVLSISPGPFVHNFQSFLPEYGAFKSARLTPTETEYGKKDIKIPA